MRTKKQMRRNTGIWIVVVLIVLLFIGREKFNDLRDNETRKNDEKENSSVERPEKEMHTILENGYSTWIVYWDVDAAWDEIDSCGEKLTDITMFEALYTGETDEVWLPNEMTEMIEMAKEKYQGKKRLYLSFVNDFKNEDGTYSQKDVKLLERLVKTEESRKRHVEEMITMVKKYELDGVELDYENLKRAEHLGDSYAEFIELLYQEAEKEGLRVKVDVEYQTAQKANLPQGPEYVVMCYNLFGEGTGPGPKADREFLITCCDNYVNQKNVTMAFSTGGFDWEEGIGCKALTERAAVELFLEKCGENGTQNRDEKSGCVWFHYTEDGKSHEVWYADAVTLNYWKQVVKEQGYERIAIWRMNGNDVSTLQKVIKDGVIYEKEE